MGIYRFLLACCVVIEHLSGNQNAPPDAITEPIRKRIRAKVISVPPGDLQPWLQHECSTRAGRSVPHLTHLISPR